VEKQADEASWSKLASSDSR